MRIKIVQGKGAKDRFTILSEQVLRRLTRIQGVGNIRSNIVLNCIKSSTEMPLGQLAPGTP